MIEHKVLSETWSSMQAKEMVWITGSGWGQGPREHPEASRSPSRPATSHPTSDLLPPWCSPSFRLSPHLTPGVAGETYSSTMKPKHSQATLACPSHLYPTLGFRALTGTLVEKAKPLGKKTKTFFEKVKTYHLISSLPSPACIHTSKLQKKFICWLWLESWNIIQQWCSWLKMLVINSC